MTVPTSLRMPESLKERIERLAEQSGESTHALTLRLLEERVSAAERYRQFVADGEVADDEMHASGVGYAAEDLYRHLDDRIAGNKSRKPKPIKWRA